ncbi:hypothetical protein J2739_003853 [Variovorax soli]|uniref:Uncharacterized protein n=1 Tax=Variovorax soli TaxID=376815 RepID=A0ABU1NJM0_9BURK|nr:hypothetical protein [Variovorax soli]
MKAPAARTLNNGWVGDEVALIIEFEPRRK